MKVAHWSIQTKTSPRAWIALTNEVAVDATVSASGLALPGDRFQTVTANPASDSALAITLAMA